MTLKVKIFKNVFWIHQRDTEIRFLAKFGENRPLQSCRKVVWITTQKTLAPQTRPSAPILPKMGRLRPKFPERCHPLTCYDRGYVSECPTRHQADFGTTHPTALWKMLLPSTTAEDCSPITN